MAFCLRKQNFGGNIENLKEIYYRDLNVNEYILLVKYVLFVKYVYII